jgi:hypothetical protein
VGSVFQNTLELAFWELLDCFAIHRFGRGQET